MRDARVSHWAAQFVGPETEYGEPVNVTPGRATRGSRYWLGEQVEALQQRRREQARTQSERSKVNAIRSIVLFVVSQIHPIPSAIRWIAFFASIVCAAIALNAWNRTLTHREQARIFPD